jgi:hypothetical protein
MEPNRQAGVIAVQAGDLALQPAEPDYDFVKLLALCRLFCADSPQHIQDKISPFIAHNLLPMTSNRDDAR